MTKLRPDGSSMAYSVYGIGGRDIAALKPFGGMLDSLWQGGDANPPLYTFLLHFWLKLGHSDIHVKTLSLLFGISAIPMMYVLVSRVGGQLAGHFSSLLLAASPAAIKYSTQARSYALFFFLSLLSTHALLLMVHEAGQKGRDKRLSHVHAGYLVAAVLTIYTHWFGLLLLTVQAIALVVYYPQSRRAFRRYSLTLIGIAVGCLPLIPFLVNQIARREGAGGFLWPGRPGVQSLYDLVAFLFGGQIPLALGVLILIVAFLVVRRAPGRQREDTSKHIVFFSVYLLLPITVVYAVSSLLTHYTFFVPRYFLVFMTGIYVLIGLSLSRLQKRTAIAAVLLFVCAPAIKLIRHSQQPETCYSKVASMLPLQFSERVAIVHLSPMSYYPVLHYSHGSRATSRILYSQTSSPTFLVRANCGGGLMSPDHLMERAALESYCEIWVVIDPIDQDKGVQDSWRYLQSSGRFWLDEVTQVAGIRLEHYISVQD